MLSAPYILDVLCRRPEWAAEQGASSMSVILGLNAFHAGAAAALLIDGRPVAAIAEERLNRVKYYARFPSQSIQLCLRMAGLKLSDVDYVAVGREPSANRGKKIE